MSEYNLTWTGATNANWDTVSTDVNWSVPTAPTPTGTQYYNGVATIFADDSPLTSALVPNTAGVATVTVAAGGVNSGGMTFTNVGAANSGVDYVIAGAAITGSGGVTLNGTGNVTLSGSNTFTGATVINAGTLIIGTDGATAGAAGNLGAVPATATPNDIVINGGTLQDKSGNTAALVLNANRGIGLGNSSGGSGTISVGTGLGMAATGILANASANPAALHLVGGGNLTLTGANTYSGGTTISGGTTLTVGESSTPMGSGAVTLSGGTLSLAGTGSAGLAGTYFQSTSVGNAFFSAGPDPHIAAPLSGVLSYFNTVTPVVHAQTTTGGQTNLSFASVAGGNAFTSQGFSGTTFYEVLFAGDIFIAQPGSYTFATTSDDGSTLFIDGNSVVNNNKSQAATTVTGTPVTLTAGVHEIDVGYYQNTSAATLTADYSGPDTGGVSIAIPNTALFAPGSSQSYANNVSVTSTSSINVAGSLVASMGGLTLTSSTLSVGSTDLTGGAYSLTFNGLTVSGTSRVNVAASSSCASPERSLRPLPSSPSRCEQHDDGWFGTLSFVTNSGSASIGSWCDDGSGTARRSCNWLAPRPPCSTPSTALANITVNIGSLTVVSAWNQQVGIVSGTPSTDVNGVTVYSGVTTVEIGDGTNAATLTAPRFCRTSLRSPTRPWRLSPRPAAVWASFRAARLPRLARRPVVGSSSNT